MIRRVSGGYQVFSHKKPHKALSRVYHTYLEAVKRLQQIQMFKHMRRKR